MEGKHILLCQHCQRAMAFHGGLVHFLADMVEARKKGYAYPRLIWRQGRIRHVSLDF